MEVYGLEEKKAIEQLRSWREYIIKHKNSVNKANDIEFYLRTALNLIEKQQAEIEKKDKIINKMGQELFIEIEPHFDTLEQCIEFYTNKVEEENK